MGSKKRSIEATGFESLQGEANHETDQPDMRKAKRVAATAAKKASALAEDANIDEQLCLNLAIGRMDPSLIADHMFRQLKRFQGSVSDAEMERIRAPRELASSPDDRSHQGTDKSQNLPFATQLHGTHRALATTSRPSSSTSPECHPKI